ncbi:hypothetical protein EJB05_46142, partial [Eragrostis curvula]
MILFVERKQSLRDRTDVENPGRNSCGGVREPAHAPLYIAAHVPHDEIISPSAGSSSHGQSSPIAGANKLLRSTIRGRRSSCSKTSSRRRRLARAAAARTSPTTTPAPPTSCFAATAATTRAGRLQRVAERAVASIAGPVRAVAVFFGANDAALADRASKLQHVPVSEYRDNLRAIRELLKLVLVRGRHPHHAATGRRGRPSAVCSMLCSRCRAPAHASDQHCSINVVRTLYIAERNETNQCGYPYAHDSSGLPERTNAAAGRYARACVDVARRCGKFRGWEKTFLRDGLHLTPSGNRLLFEEVEFAGPVNAVTVFFGANDAALSGRDSSRVQKGKPPRHLQTQQDILIS